MAISTTLLRPGFSIGLSGTTAGERAVAPFRRPWTVVLFLAVFAAAFTLPAVHTFRMAAANWNDLHTLFNLTTALFYTAWLLGWSVGLLAIYLLLATLTFGREVLLLQPGLVEIRIGLPVLFLSMHLDPARISNLHHTVPAGKTGTSWRGPHLAFDYDGRPLQFGSNLDAAGAERLADAIRAVPPGNAPHPDRPLYAGMPKQVAAATRPAPDTPAAILPRQSGNTRLSGLALIAANLIPVAGVLTLDWDLGALMVLYWAESGIIGIYHLLEIATAQRWLSLFTGTLFMSHYSVFMAFHFLFIYEFFIVLGSHAEATLTEVGRFLWELWPALLALTLSHGISFILNLPRHRATGQHELRKQMTEPYARILTMHVTIILGGGLSLLLGNPVPALLLLVALKTAADLSAHRKRHPAVSSPH